MNFHVIFVHFPIALWTLYALFEIISIERLNRLPYWFYVKAVLLIVGTLSSFVTLLTGNMIEPEFRAVQELVDTHSMWAWTSAVIFSVLAVLYAAAWMGKSGRTVPRVHTVIFIRPVLFILALFGLVAVTITGSLGGAIAYGPDVDPVVKLMYQLFVR